MKLNEEMKESIVTEFEKICGRKLDDDFLDLVSGGRDMNSFELKSAYDVLQNASKDYVNGIMSYEQYADFIEAVDNYEKYIASLPEGSPTVEFFYSAKGVYVLPDREDFPTGGVIK
ncbi:MAG: hypothetical protein ACI4WM_01535 [Erysipelotrichaceae bacterium]